MSTLIKNIAKQYPHLQAKSDLSDEAIKTARNAAFGVIYNNTYVGGTLLSSHPKGKKVASAVLDYLGHNVNYVKGSLDDF